MSVLRLPRSALPVLTTLIGSGAFIVGLWSFTSPESAAAAFGGYMVRVLESSSSPSSSDSSRRMMYIFPHGIRNLTLGLSILALTVYWQFGYRCRTSPVARAAVQRCLGLVITANALTPIVDAWVNLWVAEEGKDGDLDRNAARLHGTRSVFWIWWWGALIISTELQQQKIVCLKDWGLADWALRRLMGGSGLCSEGGPNKQREWVFGGAKGLSAAATT
ncbi:hypothetical protein AYO20_01666 [Fonsecaea nubica]|uniref:Uncharacterized protein n=1 Tax=Fonsecaea nubica TaxID=856822 RepID=A0A178DCT1_9EURO|nr:hypothetical protein AYO20_01666 [Fonsecaea nubica]OAL38915.1 hypothetical protein AYO20_01666 [Fonsecaea nubica]